MPASLVCPTDVLTVGEGRRTRLAALGLSPTFPWHITSSRSFMPPIGSWLRAVLGRSRGRTREMVPEN